MGPCTYDSLIAFTTHTHTVSYVCPVRPALTSLPDLVMQVSEGLLRQTTDPCTSSHAPFTGRAPVHSPPFQFACLSRFVLPPLSSHPPVGARKGPPAEALPAGQTLRPAEHKGWVNSSFAFLFGPTLHAERNKCREDRSDLLPTVGCVCVVLTG